MAERKGFTLWITGLSGAGKSTITDVVVDEFDERGVADRGARRRRRPREPLEGPRLLEGGPRHQHPPHRLRRRPALQARHVPVITAAISPYREIRDEARALMNGRFVEVFVATSLEDCEERDVKGLYAKARSRRDQGVHGRLRPLRGAGEPRADVETGPHARGVSAADPRLPRGAGPDPGRELVTAWPGPAARRGRRSRSRPSPGRSCGSGRGSRRRRSGRGRTPRRARGSARSAPRCAGG